MENRHFTTTAKIINAEVTITIRLGLIMISFKKGKSPKRGWITKLSLTAAGEATLKAKRDITNRVKVSNKPAQNWKARQIQNRNRRDQGRTR